MRRPSCVIATAVWGEWHVDAFLELNIPTMLAAGNLPALARRVDVTYTIHTTDADRQRLLGAPAFRRMCALVDVRFERLGHHDIGTPVETHHKIWQGSIDEAMRTSAYVILMPPDIVWAEGSLDHLGALMQAGKKAVFLSSHLRSVENTFVPDFRRRFGGNPSEIAITPRDLVRLSLQHVHPIVGAYLRESTHFPHHPEMIFWPVEGEGLLMRVLALVPFVFKPAEVSLAANRTVATALQPSELEFVLDSDDVYLVSIAPTGKDADWYGTDISLDAAEVARWWLWFDSPLNDVLAAANFRLHFAEITPNKWRQVERQAGNCVHRLIATREVFRIRRAAKALGCTKTTHVLDYVLASGLAPALVGHRHALAIFIPENAALSGRKKQIEALMHPRRHQELINLLRAHMVRLDALSHVGEPALRQYCRTESGERVEVVTEVRAAPVSQERSPGVRAGRHTLFPVPKLVLEPEPKAGTARCRDPIELSRELLAAARGQRNNPDLTGLLDAIRQPGVQGFLVQRLLGDMQYPPQNYRGFDHLSDEVRMRVLGSDPWYWHRALLDKPLPTRYKLTLAGDLIFSARNVVELEAASSFVPETRAITGIALHRMKHPEAKRLIENEPQVTGPAIREMGAAYYETGAGTAANEMFHMSLHTRGSAGFDFFSADVANNHAAICLEDYYGLDYIWDGSGISAMPRVQFVNDSSGSLGALVPLRIRRWLLRRLPHSWYVRLRDWASQTSTWLQRVRGRTRRLEKHASGHFYARGSNLREVAQRMKLASVSIR